MQHSLELISGAFEERHVGFWANKGLVTVHRPQKRMDLDVSLSNRLQSRFQNLDGLVRSAIEKSQQRLSYCDFSLDFLEANVDRCPAGVKSILPLEFVP